MKRTITLVLTLLALAGATGPAAQARDMIDDPEIMSDPGPGSPSGCCSCQCRP
jgi:hypothetical protein